MAFQVTFSPNTVGTTSTDYFHVMAIGNISKSVIKCMGSSKGIVPTTGDARLQAFKACFSLHFMHNIDWHFRPQAIEESDIIYRLSLIHI